MKLALAALALAATTALPASASTFGSISGGNDGLAPLDLTNPLNGYYGEQVVLNVYSAIKITILGYEAGNHNSFHFGSTTWQSPGGQAWYDTGVGNNDYLGAGIYSWVVNNVAPGTLNFWFGINSTNPDLVNGSNPDVTLPVPYASNFFTSYIPNQNAAGGNGVLLFLDEGGDKDYDDLVVRLEVTSPSQVPVPAAGFLLVGALGGMAALRRRKSV
jgi:hypothetical protein